MKGAHLIDLTFPTFKKNTPSGQRRQFFNTKLKSGPKLILHSGNALLYIYDYYKQQNNAFLLHDLLQIPIQYEGICSCSSFIN